MTDNNSQRPTRKRTAPGVAFEPGMNPRRLANISAKAAKRRADRQLASRLDEVLGAIDEDDPWSGLPI